MSPDKRHFEFYRDLAGLLEHYDVELVASDDGMPYGQHSSLIHVQFNSPYKLDEHTSISAADAAVHGFGQCEECGDTLKEHEDESGLRCRWCVTCLPSNSEDSEQGRA